MLGVKRHGEISVILELMTLERGRHLGLVRGGVGTRLRGVLQPGNSLRATWRARLDEHLGNYVVEGLNLRAAGYLSAAHAVHGVTHLAALCRLLAEREPHAAIYGTLDAILDQLDDPLIAAASIARFELAFLAELGFGLDLSSCAATGTTTDLIYVSPRSGRAVSRAGGDEYRDRLLALPAFLRDDATPASGHRSRQRICNDRLFSRPARICAARSCDAGGARAFRRRDRARIRRRRKPLRLSSANHHQRLFNKQPQCR